MLGTVKMFKVGMIRGPRKGGFNHFRPKQVQVDSTEVATSLSTKHSLRRNNSVTRTVLKILEEAMVLEILISSTKISVALVRINMMARGKEVIVNTDSIKLGKLEKIFGITHLLLQMMIRINFHIPEWGMKIIILESTLAIGIIIERVNNLSVVELNNILVVGIKIEKINNNFVVDNKIEMTMSNFVGDNKIENLKNNIVVNMNLIRRQIHPAPQTINKIIFLIPETSPIQVTSSITKNFLRITKITQVPLAVITTASFSRR